MITLNQVIAVEKNKTVYRDGDKCIKVFDAEYSKADVLNEALNQARIEEIGLNTPKILEVAEIDGKWAIVSQFVNGKTLAQLIEEEPEKKAEYIQLLVDLQIRIHEKGYAGLNKLKDQLSQKIAQTELEATTRYDLHTRLEGMPKSGRICHGNFTPASVIVTESDVPFIIDWVHASQGNPSADAANTYLLLLLNGDTDGAEIYLDTFCKTSDTARHCVQRWVPIVAASLSVNGNGEERAFLLSRVSADNAQ